MVQPIGFEDSINRVCLLNKAFYGLKQSARQWQKKLIIELVKIGLMPINPDKTVLILANPLVIVLTHVDDMLVFSADEKAVNKIFDILFIKFDIINMGLASRYVGIEIIRDKKIKKTIISQRGYAKQCLEKY